MPITDISGVREVALEAHADARGSMTELYRQEWLADWARPAVQSNLSRSRAGVLRGLHFHQRQSDYWCLLEGSAFVALADLRAGSGTFREVRTTELDADALSLGISIPPGVAHGFCALTDVSLLYQVDAYFTGEDEQGVAWDDPELAIAWPIVRPILSERDRANPSLADALRDLPQR